MATIDTSIYNAIGRGVRSVDDFNALADQRDAAKQSRAINALNVQMAQRKMAAEDAAMADQQALRGEQSAMYGALGGMDQKSPTFANDLMTRFPRAGGAYAKQWQDMREGEAKIGKEAAQTGKAVAETEKVQFEQARAKLDLVLQATSAAKDQRSYTQALQMLAANGVDVSKESPQFDPARVQQAGQMALTQAQRLEQVWKQKGYDLEVRRVGETVRHNKAQEGLTARGQNLADARSREGNEIQRQAGRSQVLETADGVMIVDKGTGLARPAAQMNGTKLPGKLSESTKKELTSIGQQRAAIDGALKAVAETPDAFSFGRGTATRMGGTAETIAGRFDSEAQTMARSYVYNNVSKIINERAGAAQSAQELARLRGFLPAEQDNATQVRNKLTAFKAYLSDVERGTMAGSQGAPQQVTKAMNWGDLK